MADIEVGALKLNISAGAGHEHRFAGVARRAANLFAMRAQQRFGPTAHDLRIDAIAGAPLSIDWSIATDEDAASLIADAWLGTMQDGLGEL